MVVVAIVVLQWCYTRHRWWSVGASELVAVADRRRASTEQKLLRLTGKGFYLVTSPYMVMCFGDKK